MLTFRDRLNRVFEGSAIHWFIGSLIIINMVLLGFETSQPIMATYGPQILFVNGLILAIFGVEIIARIIAQGSDFFKDPWHVMDFFIVAIALLTFGGIFQIFRVLRIIWLLRLITVVPQFQHLVDAIARAIPHLLSVALLLLVTIYTFAVIGTIEFGHTTPKLFGDLYTSMGTIAQTMLMEHTWSERLEVLEHNHEYAWVYIFTVMILLNYLLLHLVLGVIITALHQQFEQEKEHQNRGALLRLLSKTKTDIEEKPLESLSPDLQIVIHHITQLRDEIKHLKK